MWVSDAAITSRDGYLSYRAEDNEWQMTGSSL